MNFRRIPFQFNATNPAERQSELMRRFGVSDEDNTEETSNRPTAGATGPSSPRLQCRLPDLYAEKETMKIHPEDQPKVRIIPIEVETPSGSYIQKHQSSEPWEKTPIPDIRQRYRSSSGSNVPPTNGVSHTTPTEGRAYRIPVVVEGKDAAKPKSSSCADIPVHKQKCQDMNPPGASNGPCASKPKADGKKKPIALRMQEVQSLVKIAAILKEFQSFKGEVEKFSEQSEKKYRYLDEMLTRLMLKLDGIETYGVEEVRTARKAAIKEVQDCIDVLDLKIRRNSAESVARGGEAGAAIEEDTEEKNDRTSMDVSAACSDQRVEQSNLKSEINNPDDVNSNGDFQFVDNSSTADSMTIDAAVEPSEIVSATEEALSDKNGEVVVSMKAESSDGAKHQHDALDRVEVCDTAKVTPSEP